MSRAKQSPRRYGSAFIVGFAILLGVISTAAALTQSKNRPGTLVLSEAANSTTIQVTPDSLGADTVKAGASSYMNLFFRGALTENAGEGNFIRQFLPVMVGVFSRQVQVHVAEADYETISMPATSSRDKTCNSAGSACGL